MIKLKDILLESTAPDIFIPRRIEGRVERLIKNYIRNGSKGNLSLQFLKLTELPAILKDITVDGSFDCSNNKLTSLINAPKFVGGTFYCENNKLTSLEGASTNVGGGFYCRNNTVQFTEDQVRAVCDVKGKIIVKDILLESTAPDIFVPRRMEDRIERMIKNYIRNGSKGDLDLSRLNLTVLPEILKDISVDGDFFCNGNNLTSLEGAPKTVNGDFGCGNNHLTTLDGAPETVGGSFYCSFNNLTSLTGAPKFVGGVFSCGFNEIKFTEQQVRAVCNVKGDIYGAL